MAKEASRLSGEERLIARYFRPLAKHPGAFGLLDDAAAVVPPKGCDLVLTTDGLISGVHFFPDDPAHTVAKKALRVNLSDLAAKGAAPLGFLLALALPRNTDASWLKRFTRGLKEDAAAFVFPLLGGDTDRTPGPLSISVVAVGAVPHGQIIRRSGARTGHAVVVTGSVGDSALGLMLRRAPGLAKRWGLSSRHREYLADRYLLPQPRTAIAAVLRRHAAASMDISDGLVGDLTKLCRTSKVAAEIEIERVPLSDAARAALGSEPSLMETLLTGGDDYEVLATMPGTELAAFRRAALKHGIAVTQIGKVVAGAGEARFMDTQKTQIAFARPAYSHF
jgi:thiamine-monophosphate kinase